MYRLVSNILQCMWPQWIRPNGLRLMRPALVAIQQSLINRFAFREIFIFSSSHKINQNKVRQNSLSIERKKQQQLRFLKSTCRNTNLFWPFVRTIRKNKPNASIKNWRLCDIAIIGGTFYFFCNQWLPDCKECGQFFKHYKLFMETIFTNSTAFSRFLRCSCFYSFPLFQFARFGLLRGSQNLEFL